MQNGNKNKIKSTQNLNTQIYYVKMTIKPVHSSGDILFETIDKDLSSLGHPVKTAMYSALQYSCRIGKQEISFGAEEFQNALGKTFGIGSRYIEILSMKDLHKNPKVKCRRDNSPWVYPTLPFQDYEGLAEKNLETHDATKNAFGRKFEIVD